VHGLPADELIKASQGADMVVLGRRGMGGFATLMQGSVTSQVTHHAHSAVLVVPPAE
jgi:nucleotide-binding universal stress UspA family protein